jgi:S1-C subfamily serine protease
MPIFRRLRVARLLTLSVAMLCFGFSMGTWFSRDRIDRRISANDNAIAELRDQVARDEWRAPGSLGPRALGTAGSAAFVEVGTDAASRGRLVEDIKGQLQKEMGLVPIRVLRERRASFVPVHAYDEAGSLRYGTAGYLGGGYFITVKHGVRDLNVVRGERRMKSVKILYDGKALPATIVDSGSADVEVHPGDWAILKVRDAIDLPALQIDVTYPYEFAEPIFRLGNDYSKGIIVSTGYVGQRMDNGLISCLTDGHPGVSGGGVLDVNGHLVGIPVGRMDGDFRFSFILPLRAEMFRKVPDISQSVVVDFSSATEHAE